MKVENGRFLDSSGRVSMLRGCCLGGDSKLPFAAEPLSFVGRPFPAEEADGHFGRLRSWGFNFLRLVVPWEALEHAGPGIYDESYLAYLRKVLKKAEEYGFSVYIDTHQDLWGRSCGGDGAPAWTLEKVGMDPAKVAAAGAGLFRSPGDPEMAWPTGYCRYAAATMFTLFFAGDAYAPALAIDGESAQSWLQGRYIAAWRHAFRRLKDCRALVGWGAMNEPHPGFAGLEDLGGLERCPYAVGAVPTPFQAMAAASGHSTEAGVFRTGLRGRRRVGNETLNPTGADLFLDGFSCPWKAAGVWTDEGGEPRLLRADHFARLGDRKADFAGDFLKPFLKRFAATMQEYRPETLIFIEGAPLLGPEGEPSWSAADGSGIVAAPHWYDGPTLVTKKYRRFATVDSATFKPVVGPEAVRRSFVRALADKARLAAERQGGLPVLIGEFGLPFDLSGGRAYRDGNYGRHEEALSAYYGALDENLLSGTIWNYSAGNTHADGDGWNGEDLSIWSTDGGARAEAAWLRPYPAATAGVPLSLRWDPKARRLEYRYRQDAAASAPTELFAPERCFGGEATISAEPADAVVVVREGDAVQLFPVSGRDGEVLVVISGR